MNLEETLIILKGLPLKKNEKRFVCDTLALHDVLEKVLDRFNLSDFAYKKAQKAKALGQSEGAIAYFRKEDNAYNHALLNTLNGAVNLAKKWEKSAHQPNIYKPLNNFITSKDRFPEFKQSFIDACIQISIDDNTISGIDAVWSMRALTYYLNLGHQEGISALFQDFNHSLERFQELREDLETGRSFMDIEQIKEIAPYLVESGDFTHIQYADLVHFWGIRWITVFKTILRAICYVFIICFIWEDAEIVKEWKKIWVCKLIRPEDFNPADVG